jgi:hypothetical protein
MVHFVLEVWENKGPRVFYFDREIRTAVCLPRIFESGHPVKRVGHEKFDHLVTSFVACGHGKGRLCMVNIIALFPNLDLEL